MSEKAKLLLQELLVEVGLAPQDINIDGHCAFMVNDDYAVNIELRVQEKRLFFSSLVSAVSGKGKTALLAQAMELNLALYKELGMSLGLESYSNSLVLSQSISVDELSIFELQNHLACFLEQSEKCRCLFEQNKSQPEVHTIPNPSMCV